MLRTLFLIASAGVALHLPVLTVCGVVAGYVMSSTVDKLLGQKVRRMQFDYETSGRTQDPSDPAYETKKDQRRLRLEPPHSIVVNRIAKPVRR
jgi:hypothetical protein